MICLRMNHFVGSAEKSFCLFIKLEGGILRDQNEKGSVKEIHNFDTKNIVDMFWVFSVTDAEKRY